MNSESHKTIDKVKVAEGKHPYSYKVSVTRLCERKVQEDGKPSTNAFSLSIYQIILKPAKVGSFGSRRFCTWRSQTESCRTVPNPLIKFRPMVSDHFIKILLWLLVRYWWDILCDSAWVCVFLAIKQLSRTSFSWRLVRDSVTRWLSFKRLAIDLIKLASGALDNILLYFMPLFQVLRSPRMIPTDSMILLNAWGYNQTAITSNGQSSDTR
ncbi:hypothetical protein AAC387_Pa05g0148 [Persea americana]